MGIAAWPQQCEDTEHAKSSALQLSLPPKSVRFNENAATFYTVSPDMPSSPYNYNALSGLKNNEALLRTVMYRINSLSGQDCYSKAIMQKYADPSSRQDCYSKAIMQKYAGPSSGQDCYSKAIMQKYADPSSGQDCYSKAIMQKYSDTNPRNYVELPGRNSRSGSPDRFVHNSQLDEEKGVLAVNARHIIKRVNVKKPGSTRNDANNNFIALPKEMIRAAKWKDENVFNRTEVLAQPKPLPCGYEEEKEATYWISKKPPPIPKAGYTTSVASARVEELAKPMYNSKGEFVGNRHCQWDEEAQTKKVGKDPDCVDWDRLATPRPRYADATFDDKRGRIKDSALKFEATKRLHQLAVPKKKIDCGAYYLWLWNRKPDVNEKLHEIKQLSIDKTDMEDARILLRCDLDFTEGKSIEQKICHILPTVRYAFKKKARAVIIISHCGTPNGKFVKEFSLESLLGLLEEALPENHVVYLDNCIGAEAKALCEDPEGGHVFLLENLRFHPEELGYTIDKDGKKVVCKKEAIEKFHKILLSFGDVYVNEAFTILHEDPITNFGDPKKERCYGLHIKNALKIYNYFIVKHHELRLVAVIGGTYEEVADIVSAIMGKAAEILLGGEIAMMFLHTVKGIDIGETECTPYHQKKIRDMMTRARDTGTVINLPADVVLEHVNAPRRYFTGHCKDNIDDYYKAIDIGNLTRECYRKVMLSADMLIWYGRMGKLHDGTFAIANSFSDAKEEYGIETYLLDNETIANFFQFCPGKEVSHLTEKSEVTMSFLHRKVLKSVASLSPWRRRVKKRPPKEVQVSTKPVSYGTPCLKMCNAMDRLAIDELDFKDKKVIIRCDLNVPMANGEVADRFRIRMAIPSICYALQRGAHAVIVVSSLGNQHGRRVESESLKVPSSLLAKYLHITEKAVVFVSEPTLIKVQAALKNCYPGTVIVVENINFREEEFLFRQDIKDHGLKETQRVANFCHELSCLGDVYVNDSFDNLQVHSASTCGIMLKKRACGFLLKNELRYLSTIFNAPVRPILVILGGVYSRAKIAALKSLLREIDEVILTGRIALAFLKVVNKMPTGASVTLEELEAEVPTIVEMAEVHKVRIHYPVDFVVSAERDDASKVKQLSASVGIPADWYAVDIGDNSCSLFKQVVKRSKLIFWHGVSGLVEVDKFRKGTQTLLDVISMVTKDPEFGVVSIMGGNSVLSFAHSVDPDFQGVSHMTTGGLSCAAIVKDRCLPPIGFLAAGRVRQNLNKLAVKDLDITDKTVILRANMNAPRNAEGTQITDLTCIKALMPTITSLQKRGARCITLIGTYGNPEGNKVDMYSLLPFKTELEKRLRQEITFFADGVTNASITGGSGGKVFMLENLLFHPEEQGWEENSQGERMKMEHSAVEDYRKHLTSLGEIFVNDSLESLCHCDSSVVGVTPKIKCAGFFLKNELAKFGKFLEKMHTPLLVIAGAYSGSINASQKLEMLYDLLDQATDVLLCGDLAYTHLKVAMPMAKLDQTPVDPDLCKLWPRVIMKAKLNGVRLQVPVDFTINDRVEVPPEEAEGSQQSQQPPPPPGLPGSEQTEEEPPEVKLVPVVRTAMQGPGADFRAMDLGPVTVENYLGSINKAGSILVMGPMGEFVEKDYDEGSKAILEGVREAMTENGTPAIAFDQDTYYMLESLDKMETVSHCSLAGKSCTSLITNLLLPGLDLLDFPKSKPLKKLSVDRFNIAGKRVLLRLDLDVPIVGGVILDVSKVDAALPTIRYLLDKNAKCVVLMGHRGQPQGYKNTYLTMEPLAAHFARLLDKNINFLPYPCSAKVRAILESPEPGSVFLMENLKFYPAEEGKDLHRKSSTPKVSASSDENTFTDIEGALGSSHEGGGNKGGDETADEDTATAAEGGEDNSKEGGGGEESEDKEGTTAEAVEETAETIAEEEEGEENDEYISFTDTEDLDRPMYEKMALKSLKRYVEELSQCGDVFVNDDLHDLHDPVLTSMTGLTLKKRMCGPTVSDWLSKAESDDVYKYTSVATLSPAPKEGEMDDLILS